MKNRSINYNVITIVQIFMAIVVIAIHTNPFCNIKSEAVLKLWENISLLAVPFFFFTSAWFFAAKLTGDKHKDLIFIKNTIWKYIKMYVLWNVIYLPITFYSIIQNYGQYGLIKTVFYYIYGLFIKGQQFYSWPLWYLLSIIYAFILVFIVKKYLKGKYSLLIFGIIDLLFLFCLNHLVQSDFINSVFQRVFTDRPLKGFFYIVFGISLYEYREKMFEIKSVYYVLIFLLCFILYYYSIFDGIFDYLFRVLCSGLFFIIVMKFAYLCQNKMDFLSKYSFRKISVVMYYTHMIFYFLYCLLISGFDNSGGFIAFLVSFVGTLLLSIVVILSPKNKIFQRIF